MKRAVSSIDASAQAARSSTGTHRLKRCKSAFANLTRLGAAASGSTSPSTPPRQRPSPAPAEEDLLVLPPRWRHTTGSCDAQHSSEGAGPVSGAAGTASGSGACAFVFGSMWPEAAAPLVPMHHHHHHHQSFTPHHGTGAERRLFISRDGAGGSVGAGGQGRDEDGFFATGRSCGAGAASVRPHSRKNSFASGFSFSAVPEDEIIATGAGGGRCPFLHQQQHHLHRQEDQGDEEDESLEDDFWGGAGGTAASLGGIGGAGGEHVSTCWVEPGSPAFSISGFGEDEEGEWDEGLGGGCSTAGSPTKSSSALAAGMRERFAAAVSGENSAAFGSTSVTASSAVTGGDQKQPAPPGSSPSSLGDAQSSPMLLLRLQRRFEEMLLVSKVAT